MHNLKLMAELLFTSCYQKSLLVHSFVQKKKASEFKKLQCGIRDFCIFVLSMHTLLFSPKWTRSLANQHHQGDFQLHSRNRPFTFFVVLVAVITARCATFCGPWATFNETLISYLLLLCLFGWVAQLWFGTALRPHSRTHIFENLYTLKKFLVKWTFLKISHVYISRVLKKKKTPSLPHEQPYQKYLRF